MVTWLSSCCGDMVVTQSVSTGSVRCGRTTFKRAVIRRDRPDDTVLSRHTWPDVVRPYDHDRVVCLSTGRALPHNVHHAKREVRSLATKEVNANEAMKAQKLEIEKECEKLNAGVR